MTPGRKPRPTALRRRNGNPGKRGHNPAEPGAPDALPRCPDHLSAAAKKEWRRLATPLHRMGVLTVTDRAALAAYCQCWARWVEAELRLAETPLLLKTPSGYVQQSPWLSVSNKQRDLMGRYMAELGLTPASRTRVAMNQGAGSEDKVRIVVINAFDRPDDTGVPDGSRLDEEDRARGAAAEPGSPRFTNGLPGRPGET